MKQAAHALSLILHPLFMTPVALWMAMHLDPHVGYFLPTHARLILLGMVFLMAVLFPLSSMVLLRRAGLISSLEMPHREERIPPFVMTLIYYAMTYYLLQRSGLDITLLSLFAGAFLALLLTTLITLRWKISVHMVGIGGLVGTVAGLADIHGVPVLHWLAGTVLLAGALGTARLLTNSHGHAQVYAGGALGFACTYLAVATGLHL